MLLRTTKTRFLRGFVVPRKIAKAKSLHTVAAAIRQSSIPIDFKILTLTNILNSTTMIVKPQKKPLIASIEGALVEVSVDEPPATSSNLKTEGISMSIRYGYSPAHTIDDLALLSILVKRKL